MGYHNVVVEPNDGWACGPSAGGAVEATQPGDRPRVEVISRVAAVGVRSSLLVTRPLRDGRARGSLAPRTQAIAAEYRSCMRPHEAQHVRVARMAEPQRWTQ